MKVKVTICVFLFVPLSPRRKPAERERRQVCGAAGGQAAEVRLLFFSVFLQWKTLTEQNPQRNFLSPLPSSNQIAVSSMHHLTDSSVQSHLVVSQSRFLTFHSVSHLHFVFIFSPSNVFYVFTFISIFPHILLLQRNLKVDPPIVFAHTGRKFDMQSQ